MTKLLSFVLSLVCLSAVCTVAKSSEPVRPLVVAHRGLLRHAPENTLANFRACLELRVGFEFDVQRTQDGHLVCIHDDTVDRTTNGRGKVSEMTLAEIRELDAGSWFDPVFAGEKVPAIDEVMRLAAEYKQHEVLIAADLKAENVGQAVVKLAEKHGVLHRLIFIGRAIAEPALREQIKAASLEAHTAAVANNVDEFADALSAPQTDWVYFRFLPTKQQIDAVHQAGKRSFIAGPTVSGHLPDNWLQATDVGIDAILTDFPLELRKVHQTCRVRAVTTKNGDQVDVLLDDKQVVFSITSETGIGAATIERLGPAWPEKVVLRLHLRGLESLGLSNGQATVVSAYQSSEKQEQVASLQKLDMEPTAITPADPYWLNITIRSLGTAAESIPLESGYFEAVVPGALLTANPDSINVRWIDFYR